VAREGVVRHAGSQVKAATDDVYESIETAIEGKYLADLGRAGGKIRQVGERRYEGKRW
jgi:hypothetical protein